MTRPYPKGSHAKRQAATHAVREARAKEWMALFRGGMPLETIGARVGVTGERVRQIITEFYGSVASESGRMVAARKKREQHEARRNARALAKYGCTYAQYTELRDAKVPPLYFQQISNARHRGIEWNFKLWDWWQVWLQSGKWTVRGPGHGYCMCRYMDAGAYEPGNVYIGTGVDNVQYNRKVVRPLRQAEAAP